MFFGNSVQKISRGISQPVSFYLHTWMLNIIYLEVFQHFIMRNDSFHRIAQAGKSKRIIGQIQLVNWGVRESIVVMPPVNNSWIPPGEYLIIHLNSAIPFSIDLACNFTGVFFFSCPDHVGK